MSPKNETKSGEKPDPKSNQKSAKKDAKKGPAADQAGKGKRLPLIMEASFSLSGLSTLLVSAAVLVISFLSGASLLNILLRTGAAILGMGLLSWLVTYRLINNWVEGLAAEQAEQAEAMKSLDSTVELKA